MSSRIPPRRLGQSALAALQPGSTRWAPSTSLPSTFHRSISNPFKRKSKAPADQDLTNPLLDQYLKRREIEEGTATGQDKQKSRPILREGTLPTDPSSPFYAEREVPGWKPDLSPEEETAIKLEAKRREDEVKAAEEPGLMAMNLDPAPKEREKWQRNEIVRTLLRHGRLTKAQKIARTERQSQFTSQALPTSVKKLQKLANQIAGKTVSEALVQLRFSKKRVARDMIKGLEIAQNEAIAGRGMGLGGGLVAQRRWERQRALTDRGAVKDLALDKQDKRVVSKEKAEERSGRPVTIEMKDGSKKVVRDPTEIYIDQAWVGKGEMWKSPEFRARGMVNMLRHRTTKFSVLLKEEKTRMRLSEEIKKKRDNRKLWTALPDRPVTAQRQYCLW